ncbi:MAG: hypothetical protein RL326_1701 [Pseudomonadota bacterium]|jgi:hypothetical protein
MVTKIRSIIAKAHEATVDVARKVSLIGTTPTEKQAQMILFSAGIVCLGIALSHDALANGIGASGGKAGFDDARIANATQTVMRFLEGSFGALIMAASGIGAIMSAAFGQYKMALSCMVVAVGAFILRSMMNTFFNIQSLQADGSGTN